MDFTLFLEGLISLLISFLIYFFLIRKEKISSQETGRKGVTYENYIGLWGSVILCFILGVVLIFKSLIN